VFGATTGELVYYYLLSITITITSNKIRQGARARRRGAKAPIGEDASLLDDHHQKQEGNQSLLVIQFVSSLNTITFMIIIIDDGCS
jgi:hypothetical protein